MELHKIKSVFLISDDSYGSNQLNGFEVHKFSKYYSSFYKELESLVSSGLNNILLHYVNYGYQKKGVPYYLPLVLNRIKKEFKEVKIIINFHELYAKGNFPSSSFFLHSLQKRIFKMLVDAGDVFFTSMNMYGRIIKESDKTKKKAVNCFPLFSSAGVLNNYIPLNKRKKQIVVFGSMILRLRLYSNNINELFEICNNYGFSKIIDIGEKTGINFNLPQNITLIQTGKLNNTEISELLLDSSAAVINYPAAYLAKSSVFASYAAHALPVFCFTEKIENEDGLVDGLNYISSINKTSFDSFENISKNIFEWYSKHSISSHIEFYKSSLV